MMAQPSNQPQSQYQYFIPQHSLLQQHPHGYPSQTPPTTSSTQNDSPRFKIEGKEPTLELLQSRFSRPLVEVAKEFHVSLTMMKRLCRKLGIQRWPHRQIRSLDKLLNELEGRVASTTSARDLEYLREQIALLSKKRRLVTRGASSGMQGPLRNALFMADPSTLLDEDELFNEKKLGQLEEALSSLPPSEQRKVMHKGDTNPVLKIMTAPNAKPLLKRKRMKVSTKLEGNAVRLKEDNGDNLGQINPAMKSGKSVDGRSVNFPQQMNWPPNIEHSQNHMGTQFQGMPPHMGIWPWSYEMMMQNSLASSNSVQMDPRSDMGYIYNPFHSDPSTAAAMFQQQQMQQHPMFGMGGPMFAGPIPFIPQTQMDSNNNPVSQSGIGGNSRDYPPFAPPSAYQNLAGLGMYRDGYPKHSEGGGTVPTDMQTTIHQHQTFIMQMHQQALMSAMQAGGHGFNPNWNNSENNVVSSSNGHLSSKANCAPERKDIEGSKAKHSTGGEIPSEYAHERKEIKSEDTEKSKTSEQQPLNKLNSVQAAPPASWREDAINPPTGINSLGAFQQQKDQAQVQQDSGGGN